MSNPYAQQPAAQQYGQQPYGTGAPAATNTSAIVLTILSGVSMMFGNLLAVGSLVLGIMALTSNSTDPVGSRKKTKTGWIIFAVVWAVAFVVLLIAVIALVAFMPGSGSGFGY